MGTVRKVKRLRTVEQGEVRLNKIGFWPSALQREDSDFIRFSHRTTVEFVLVDFALGRFIYGEAGDCLATESSTSYENDPRYNEIIDALFCDEILDDTPEALNEKCN